MSTHQTPRVSVLIIDDDPAYLAETATLLTDHGFAVQTALDGAQMRDQIQSAEFDLFILDLLLPGTSGKVLCRQLVEAGRGGIIVVSAVDDDEERIALLELGADDYIVKPFNPKELLARMRAVLRRVAPGPTRRINQFGKWTVGDGENRLIGSDGLSVALTPSEARLMRLFLGSPGLVFDREELLAVSRVRQHGGGSDRSVDNLIRRLRQKIEQDPNDPRHIQTDWGHGYVFRV